MISVDQVATTPSCHKIYGTMPQMSKTIIQRNSLLPYSCRQMFELVNGIEDYPRFLPWCSGATILHNDGKIIEASLDLSWSGMHKSFTTRNSLLPYEKIDIELVDGPFRHLEGVWRFTPLGEGGCKVELNLEFEFAGHFMDFVFQPIFQKIANSLVDLFTKRAFEIYGNRKED